MGSSARDRARERFDARCAYCRVREADVDDLAHHVEQGDDGHLAGRTPEGAFFIEKLRLDRAPLVAYRLRARASAARAAEVDAARRRVRELEERIEELREAVDAAADEIRRRSSLPRP